MTCTCAPIIWLSLTNRPPCTRTIYLNIIIANTYTQKTGHFLLLIFYFILLPKGACIRGDSIVKKRIHSKIKRRIFNAEIVDSPPCLLGRQQQFFIFFRYINRTIITTIITAIKTAIKTVTLMMNVFPSVEKKRLQKETIN